MGIDAVIFFKLKDDASEPELHLPEGFEVRPWASEYGPNTATHEVDTMSRFYGPGYERGHWPSICAVLMSLHACLDVETVWYDGDSGDCNTVCTPETVLALSRHFMDYGDRPYRGYFQGERKFLPKVHAAIKAQGDAS